MDRNKLVALINDNSYGKFIDDDFGDFIDGTLKGIKNYTSEEYPEFLADRIIAAYTKHELD